MSKRKFFICTNLHLFEDGAGSGDGATGVTSGATDQNGVNAQVTDEQNVDRSAEFEKMIKGDYKSEYDRRVQDIVKNRLKGSKETEARLQKLAPVIELLSNRYGVDASDIDQLSRAMMDDDSYYEDEALERGLTVQQLKEIKNMERENKNLRDQVRERESQERANAIYQSWMEQSEKVKMMFPTFDFNLEIQNPKFAELLQSNIDVATAYKVIHQDEILGGAMQYTANAMQQKVAASVRANGMRPTENGIKSTAASITTNDPSKLTKAQRQELALRAARGEHITFR